ncbi:class I SAM-dependent methyltransferase [Fulvivirga sediminis]|uniref:Class I SAM-dependent methyltransferase n=1 Tax=Fulvivirga sediminis TaxID=2803949 RepID=A0A937JYV9_9BACT|nr:class I SAM-dependent methyltransferase [Fulvivirga sediminis]MBL3654536.1 class I SAM-dependent methyltransferase [Fulvivirga sediminis]
MLETLNHCPICSESNYKLFLTCQDYTVSQDLFNIVECTNCNFLYTNPRPFPKDLGKYYKSDDYISHSNKSNNLTNFTYRIARNYTLKGKLSLVNRLQDRKTKLLDLGCGTGHFLKICSDDGWKCTGVEPDPDARKQATEQGLKVFSNIEGVSLEQYNVISMWHVLEHVPNLNDYLSFIKTRLASNGHLIVAVPNHQSHDAKNYQDKWAAYDVPRHLYHFDQNSMAKLMHKHSLQIKEVKPMKLDSYYVSLLSESYKGSGIAKFPKAFLEGIKSNRYANNNHNNYSSLIYIIEHLNEGN